ncbi:FecR family protein [uncultured Cyclobacterium sp.]|uniref:FecR family protein n=1 Tax=uncultured Cyclobacterium sp. TaxID=453820 RepID=UPI0030EC8D51|tara:strand:+ start:274714 stop:275754 length:1041 start_codon:yes stop_codon:yes gene_type:complete
MKYEDYTIDNFLMDDFFIHWVKNPNENNRHFWEKWLEQHPEKRDMVMKAAIIISSVHYESKPLMGDRRYVEAFENILKADNDSELKKTERGAKSLNFKFPWRMMAAGVMILFCLGISYKLIINPSKAELSESDRVTMIKRVNPAGKKSILTLSDGSRIFLNSGSEISYPSGFNDSLRLVSLRGEAFFEVQKEKRPFVVKTGQTKIKVLGTSFNVNQKQNGALTVALVTGKVIINDQKGNEMQLAPSEIMVRGEDGAFHKTGFDPLTLIGWKDKILVFRENSFVEVKEKIENWFGVTLHLEGEIDTNMTYSGTYKEESLENVLRGMLFTSGLAYEIEDKMVTIKNTK